MNLLDHYLGRHRQVRYTPSEPVTNFVQHEKKYSKQPRQRKAGSQPYLFRFQGREANIRGRETEKIVLTFLEQMVSEGILKECRAATQYEDNNEKTDCWFSIADRDVRLQIKSKNYNKWYKRKIGVWNIYWVELNQKTRYEQFRSLIREIVADVIAS